MKIAQWLLTNFGVDETLHGDLLEERAAGRSALWLLRQTLAAIVVQVGRDLRSHPLLALRAIATGWILDRAWWLLGRPFVPRVHEAIPTGFVLYRILTMFVFPALAGWAVARTDRSRPASMMFAYAVSAIIGYGSLYLIHFDEFRRIPMLYFAKITIMLLGILVGGLLQQRPRQRGTS